MHRSAVSSGEQCSARRCADGRGVEIGVAQTILGQLIKRGRADFTPEGAGSTESDVIEQYPDNIGRACRGFDGIRPPLLGVGQGLAYMTLIGLLISVDSAHERDRRGQRRGF